MCVIVPLRSLTVAGTSQTHSSPSCRSCRGWQELFGIFACVYNRPSSKIFATSNHTCIAVSYFCIFGVVMLSPQLNISYGSVLTCGEAIFPNLAVIRKTIICIQGIFYHNLSCAYLVVDICMYILSCSCWVRIITHVCNCKQIFRWIAQFSI